jgi:acyl phosphate:glycerol-3-phosphate acyltransferase
VATAWDLRDALAVLLGYAAGSIPFGLLIGLAKGVDIRREGSGNIGASNVGRLLGKPYGILVFLLDLAKGAVPVFLIKRVGWPAADEVLGMPLDHYVGIASVLGHMFPVWLRFRGGKGVATALGVFLVLATEATLIAFLVWCVCVFAWQYVSLASIVAAWSLPLAMLVIGSYPWTLLVLTSMLAALVTFRHRANVGRLLRGEEAQAKWTRPSR